MAAFAGERVEVKRKRGDERFSFARGHFGDFVLVQGDAAYELDIVMNHLPFDFVFADRYFLTAESACGVFDGREGFGQYGVERFAVLVAFFKFLRLGFEGFVGELLVLLFYFVYFCDYRAGLFIKFFIVAAGEKFDDF